MIHEYENYEHINISSSAVVALEVVVRSESPDFLGLPLVCLSLGGENIKAAVRKH